MSTSAVHEEPSRENNFKRLPTVTERPLCWKTQFNNVPLKYTSTVENTPLTIKINTRSVWLIQAFVMLWITAQFRAEIMFKEQQNVEFKRTMSSLSFFFLNKAWNALLRLITCSLILFILTLMQTANTIWLHIISQIVFKVSKDLRSHEQRWQILNHTFPVAPTEQRPLRWVEMLTDDFLHISSLGSSGSETEGKRGKHWGKVKVNIVEEVIASSCGQTFNLVWFRGRERIRNWDLPLEWS